MFQHSSVSIRKPNYLTNWEKYLYYAIDKETNPMEPFGFGFGSSSVLEIEIVGLDSLWNRFSRGTTYMYSGENFIDIYMHIYR